MKKVYSLFLSNWILRFIALQMILLSLTIVLSEITLYLNINVSLVGMLVETSIKNLFCIHILTVLPLAFLFYACLYGMFNLKISGLFGMYKNKQTDSTSLLFMSSFMCRVGFPLCINFAQILKLKKKTILEDIVGSTKLDPIFGEKFFLIYPCILIFLILLNMLNIYERLIRLFGLSSHYNRSYASSMEKTKDGEMILNKSKFI